LPRTGTKQQASLTKNVEGNKPMNMIEADVVLHVLVVRHIVMIHLIRAWAVLLSNTNKIQEEK
jgi:hypothetical protein